MPLTVADASALADPVNAPDVASSSPVVNADATIVAGSVSYAPQQFVGTTPSYATAHAYQAAEGRMFTGADLRQRRRVVVLGQTVAQNLFPGQDALGQTVEVNGASFQVVASPHRRARTGPSTRTTSRSRH